MKRALALGISTLMAVFSIECGNGDSAEAGDSDGDTDYDADCSDDGICNDPPDDFCSEDGTQFISYTGEATCVDGECQYSTEIQVCYEFWSESVCMDGIGCSDPCTDVDCSEEDIEQPDDYCIGDTLTIYEDTPICMFSADMIPECHYLTEETTDCPNGCVEVEDGDDYCAE